MFRLLEILFSAAREPEGPWSCPECGQAVENGKTRAHLAGHRARTVSASPLVVELRATDPAKDLGPAIAELKRRWPGRTFQLLPGSFWEGREGGGMRLRTVLAVENDRTIAHDPFGPV